MALRSGGDGPWILIHRYIGLFVGIWMCAVGLTGTVMAYYREIDAFLNPGLFAATNSPRHPDLDAMVSTVNAAYPDRFILYLDRYFLSQDETYPFVLSEPMPVTAGGLDLAAIGNFEAAASLELAMQTRPENEEILTALIKCYEGRDDLQADVFRRRLEKIKAKTDESESAGNQEDGA